MPLKKLVLLATLLLTACSRSPSCADNQIACEYKRYIYEGSRLPPRYNKAESIIYMDKDFKEIPNLISQTKDNQENVLSEAVLSRTAYKVRGSEICHNPDYVSILRTIVNKSSVLRIGRSVAAQVRDIPCVDLNNELR